MQKVLCDASKGKHRTVKNEPKVIILHVIQIKPTTLDARLIGKRSSYLTGQKGNTVNESVMRLALNMSPISSLTPFM